jgi:hypothetical protein
MPIICNRRGVPIVCTDCICTILFSCKTTEQLYLSQSRLVLRLFSASFKSMAAEGFIVDSLFSISFDLSFALIRPGICQ